MLLSLSAVIVSLKRCIGGGGQDVSGRSDILYAPSHCATQCAAACSGAYGCSSCVVCSLCLCGLSDFRAPETNGRQKKAVEPNPEASSIHSALVPPPSEPSTAGTHNDCLPDYSEPVLTKVASIWRETQLDPKINGSAATAATEAAAATTDEGMEVSPAVETAKAQISSKPPSPTSTIGASGPQMSPSDTGVSGGSTLPAIHGGSYSNASVERFSIGSPKDLCVFCSIL